MTTQKTLKELFESHKEELSEKLGSLSLPKDAPKIQSAVTDYLNVLFDSDGEFRQTLTQSEDYILQAAMSLLNAQQAMASEFSDACKNGVANLMVKKAKSTSCSSKTSVGLKKELFPHAIGATAFGGAVGGLVLGTWGALFGSIAGTALILYSASLNNQSQQKATENAAPVEMPTANKLDIDRFTAIVSNICGSIDSLIQTFRVQIHRVVEKYENQEKPVLEKEYGVLLDCIQSLLGISYQEKDEKWQKKTSSRIDQLAESLENYNLEVVPYDETHQHFYEEIESENVQTFAISLPAIIKQGKLVRKGKVYIKK